MSATDRRIDNLFDGLNGRERAVLAIQAWKEDRYEPSALRRNMSPEQEREFFDHINYFRALGLMVSFYAPMWREALEKHSARYAWLLTLELTEAYVSSLSQYIVSNTREQITKREHARLVAEERKKMLPLADLAELLAEDTRDWADADLEGGYVSDRAVARLTAEKKGLLRTLFNKGTIAGRRKGRGIELNLGSFYDWLGEPVAVCPDWGLDYEIVPDKQEDEARRANERRNYARSIIQRALGGSAARTIGREPSEGDLYAAVEKQLIAGVIADAREIRAADQLVAEFQQRLGGEDPLDPSIRETLDYCRTELARMREQLGVGADEAIEDCETNLKGMREFIKREQ